jgi:uncharacterized protein YukE
MALWEVGGHVGRINDLQAAQAAAHAAFEGILNEAYQLAGQTRACWVGAGEAEFGGVANDFERHSEGVQDAFQRLIRSTGEAAANWASTCSRLSGVW